MSKALVFSTKELGKCWRQMKFVNKCMEGVVDMSEIYSSAPWWPEGEVATVKLHITVFTAPEPGPQPRYDPLPVE